MVKPLQKGIWKIIPTRKPLWHKGFKHLRIRVLTVAHHVPKQARYQLRYTWLLSCIIRLGVFSQIKRDTTFATPGYLIVSIIARNSRDSKFFLTVGKHVVKTVFWSGSARGANPANASAARVSGLSVLHSSDETTALPNVARYQLRYTRIFACLNYSTK